MPDMNQHPTVVRHRLQQAPPVHPVPLDEVWLRQRCLDLGADDVGFVEIDRPALDDQRADILAAFPATRTLISYVCRMNREPIRTPARSIANNEFHRGTDNTDEVGHRIVAALEERGIRALNPSAGFPMEVQHFPNKTWVVSHKPVAVAAGLGHMGIHRNVIHPKFGNFILLGTVLIDAEVSSVTQPIDYNPCLECKLCVSACPVGAISANGDFNVTACLTHNYREFMGGFNDWVDNVVDSKSSAEYNEKVTQEETTSWWQSLSFGANYKAAYCMAVCPAGEDVIAPFLANRKQFLQEVVRPLQDKVETVFVVPGSAAEAHVLKRFPHKRIKHVGRSARLTRIKDFIALLPLVFNKEKAAGIDCTYHFTFTGNEEMKATVIIRDQQVRVVAEHTETPTIHIIADSQTWLRFLSKRANIVTSILRRRVRIKGNPRLLVAFGKIFA